MLVDGADECVLAVRKLLREKADFVKIVTSTGSFGQPYDDMKFRMCFSVGEIKAMAEEAHGQGKLIASHSVGSAGIRRAVECGIDTLEHCFFNYEKDPGLLDVIAESGAVVTPTFCIIYWLGEWEEKRHNDPRGAKNFYDNVRRHQKFVRDAFEAGIPIACGTDETGMHGVGRSAEEYAFMAEAGVPNYGILWGATSVAARALGIQDATGTIAAGKKADILVLNKSPLDDISVFRSRSGIELVMQGR